MFVGLYQRATWRRELEVCVCTLQMFGNAMFVGPELLTGCLNMVPIGTKGCTAGLTAYELFFFWFAVGINAIWLVVPAYFLVTNVLESAAQKKGAVKHSAGNGHIKSASRRSTSESPKPKGT